jgi:hypothetical protein
MPVGGEFKTLLRLHAADTMQAVPLYLPADAELEAAEVPLPTGPVAFQREKAILQREARTDNVNAERGAYAALLGIAVLWMVTVSWGLQRLDQSVDRTPTSGQEPAQVRRRRLRAAAKPAV